MMSSIVGMGMLMLLVILVFADETTTDFREKRYHQFEQHVQKDEHIYWEM